MAYKYDWNSQLRQAGYQNLGGKMFGEICRFAVGRMAELDAANPGVPWEKHHEIVWGEVNAKYGTLLAAKLPAADALVLANTPRTFGVFAADGYPIDPAAIAQMVASATLYGADWGYQRGAVMADAHFGYGPPVGSVLAHKNFVSPYAVGVDIGCMMHAFFFYMSKKHVPLAFKLMKKACRFGSADHDEPQQHPVLSSPRWRDLPPDLLAGAPEPGGDLGRRSLLDKAYRQLGTLGGGNHFADLVFIERLGHEDDTYGLYAFVTHAGSRGVGATIASYFITLAAKVNPELPLRYNGFLADSAEGESYIDAMQLGAEFAVANHQITASRMFRLLNEQISDFSPVREPLGYRLTVPIKAGSVLNGFYEEPYMNVLWNHHNMAWLEDVGGERMWVHRKGATPAHLGRFGIVPGNCGGEVAFVQGLGDPASINSSAHGAGRPHSRTVAKKLHDEDLFRQQMQGVLHSGVDQDETPQAYKPLAPVLEAQATCTEVLFKGKVVAVVMAGESGKDAGDGD